MYPSKLPIPIIIQMLGVILVVIICLFVTQNPLTLLGLYFLPQVPLIEEPQVDTHAIGYQGTGIGFTGDVEYEEEEEAEDKKQQKKK